MRQKRDRGTLRIAFLTPEFTTESKFDGGLANYLNRVARLLGQVGHEPHVLVASDRTESFVDRGLWVHRVNVTQGVLPNVHRGLRRLLRQRWLRCFDVLATACALARSLHFLQREMAFDLVQVSDFKGTGLFVRRQAGCPLIARLSYAAPLLLQASGRRPTVDWRLGEWLERRSVLRAFAVFAPSRFVAEWASRNLGREVEVIPSPIVLDVASTEEDPTLAESLVRGERLFLFFGRVCLEKGVDIFLRAARSLLKDCSDVLFVVVGRENPPGLLKELTRDWGGSERARVVFLPSMGHRQLYPLIRAARAVVLPSRVDNFPNTCLEAMALGSIVVGTAEAGFDELIEDGRTGFLIPKGDSDVLERRLRYLLTLDGEDVSRLKQNILTKVGEYHSDKVITELVARYRDWIAASRRGA